MRAAILDGIKYYKKYFGECKAFTRFLMFRTVDESDERNKSGIKDMIDDELEKFYSPYKQGELFR